jgi:putative ABC transport system permease protein
MKLLAYFRSLAAKFFHRSQTENDLDEELRSHVQHRVEDLERSGLDRLEAERRARIEFGSHERFKEECREALGGNLIDSLIQDVRFSLRTLRKSPAFFAVAIVTLASGIGATVAAFSVINAVLLRPFPFGDSDRLLWIYSQRPDGARAWFSLPEYCDYRDQNTSFEGLAAIGSYNANISDAGEPERVQGVRLSANTFGMLGMGPQLGRSLIAADDRNGAPAVAMISHGLWSRRYAKNPDVVGRSVNVNGESRQIVGVLPRNFALPNLDTDIVVPLQPESDPRRNIRNSVNFLRFVGRLKPNVTAQQAHAELDSIRQNLRRQYPDAYAGKVGVIEVPLTEEIVSNVNALLLTIFSAAGAVLLIGCTNLAGISLSRAGSRQRELAVRTALGATRRQLVRLLFTESAIIAIIGGSLGLFLEILGWRALLRLVPTDLPRIESFCIDWKVFVFASLVTLIATFVCGLAPAWLLSRSDLRDALVSGGRGSTGATRRLRGWLVAGQIALAFVLLTGAGLLFRSFARISAEQPGFDSRNLLTARLSLPQVTYPDRSAVVQYYERLKPRLTALPQIQSVALVSILPLAPKSQSFVPFTRADRPPAKRDETPTSNYRIVSPDYFRAMGIPLLSGRYFTEGDVGDRPPIVIVSAVLANKYFTDRSPIGQRLVVDDVDGDPRPVEIVGVVGQVKQSSLEAAAEADIYLPLRQVPKDGIPWLRSSSYWVIKTSPAAPAVEPLVRAEIRNADPIVALSNIRPMTEVMAAALAARRFSLLLIGSFAGAALFLSAAGLYAVISYGIQQRTQEFGVRLALGATYGSILAMIFREGAWLLASGIASGFCVALMTATLVANQMYGVSERDPLSFAFVSLLLATISLLACWIAARRALNVDPVVALRTE